MTVPVDPLAPPASPARTLPVRFRPQLLPGVALLAILAVGLGSSLAGLFAKRTEFPAEDATWSALASGETAAAVAKFVQKANPFADALVTTDRVAAWLALGDLGDRVRRGCDNWLFLTDELTLYPGRADNLARHVDIVADAAAFLKHRNIALVVVPVPDKSRIEAAARCGVERSSLLAGRLGSFVTALRQREIRVADLLPAMASVGGETYYRTDTHWNERGAKAAAEAIAGYVRQAGLAPAQKAEFRVHQEPPGERVGDLIRLAGLDRVPYPLRPRGDIEAPTVIEQSAAPSVGLLDEVAAPQIAVVGTSFSRRANFVPFLAMALGAPVENAAIDGGGVTSAAITYFEKPEFAKSPPRTVIWEIPERMLDAPVSAADLQWAAGLGR